MAKPDSPIYITPIKENYSKISNHIKNKLKIDSKYDIFENKKNPNSSKKFSYYQIKKFDDFHFSKSHDDEITNLICLNQKGMNCNVSKGTESLVGEYIKLSKGGKAKNEQIERFIYPEDEKPVDLRKINFDAFKEKRNKFKSIINVKKSKKINLIQSVYSPNYQIVQKRIPFVKFYPVAEKVSYVFRDDQSPKILRSLDINSLNITGNKKSNTKTKSECKTSKSPTQISRNKKNYSLTNLEELPFLYNSNFERCLEGEQESDFKKNQDYEYRKSYQKISINIDKEYQNFLTHLYKSSQKFYNTVLKDTLAKQKYYENEKNRLKKIELLKNKNI